MIVLKSWHFLKGYMSVKVSGVHLEKYINLLSKNGISVWDIKKINPHTIEFKMLSSQKKKALNLSEKLGYNFKVLKKYGIDRIKQKAKKRKIFIAGFFLCVMAIFAFSFFIWHVQIYGTQNIPNENIIASLKSYNVKEGRYKYSIDTDAIENKLLADYPRMSYCNISIKGSNFLVQVVEKNTPLKEFDKKESISLVAMEDTKIDSIIAYAGTPKVKKGDKVKKGQTLISGKVVYEKLGEKEYYYVHAMGEVLAIRNRNFKNIKVNPYIINKKDKYIKDSVYNIGKKAYHFKSKEDKRNYIPVEEDIKELKIGFIPTGITKKVTKWYNIKNKDKKTREQIENEVINYLNKSKNIDKDNIIGLYLSISHLDDNNLNVDVKVKVRENIAREKKIDKKTYKK